MKSLRLSLLLSLLCLLVVAEGIYALASFNRPHTSLTYRLWSILSRVPSALEGEPDPGDPNAMVIRSAWEIEKRIDSLKANGVGLGNTPYPELKTERAKVNTRIDGCLQQKPNVRKTMTQLRTLLFDPFDPVSAFYDTDNDLDPEMRAFLDAYSFRTISLHTNEYGERITVPEVDAARVVLVAGDSVANGTMLDNDETLPSQLQGRDGSRRYVNLGINAAHGRDIVCALERAEERYPRVDWLIYIYCENDFKPLEDYGEPEEVLEFLEDYVERNAIPRVTVVYSPYVYNIAPQVTRFPGKRGDGFPHRNGEKRRLRELVANAGYEWIDYVDIGLEENRRGRSQYSVLALFVDHAHYSPAGIGRLADRLLPVGGD